MKNRRREIDKEWQVSNARKRQSVIQVVMPEKVIEGYETNFYTLCVRKRGASGGWGIGCEPANNLLVYYGGDEEQ